MSFDSPRMHRHNVVTYCMEWESMILVLVGPTKPSCKASSTSGRFDHQTRRHLKNGMLKGFHDLAAITRKSKEAPKKNHRATD